MDQAAPSSGKDDALVLERFLPYRLAVLAHTVSGALSTIYRDRFDLTIPEWRVLANLGREEPSSSNRLAERGSMDKAKVSRAVARLTEAGLITRETDSRDNRLIVLRLSKRGRSVYQRIAPLALAWEADLLEGLGDEERAALDAALAKLQARAEALKGEAGG
ncbi:MAG: MarR family transcriptional regulator [Marivibrio sp.]|uniref:MarR family winged helix-turn-helix transcriptional regulator n=1 Tax=Marivibrio sp. TaxID=2039719 RepID=UPI0032EE6C0D